MAVIDMRVVMRCQSVDRIVGRGETRPLSLRVSRSSLSLYVRPPHWRVIKWLLVLDGGVAITLKAQTRDTLCTR